MQELPAPALAPLLLPSDVSTPGSATQPHPIPLPGARPTAAGATFGLLGVLTFSLTLPFTRLAVSGLDPLFVGAGRAVVAGVLAAGLLALTRATRPTAGQWRRTAVVAAGVIAGFPLLTSAAMGSLDASHGAVVIGVLPTTTAVLVVLRTRERPGPGFWLAGVAGLAAVVVFLLTSTGGFGRVGTADLLLLGAVVLAATGYAEGGVLARELGSWQTICWALVLALPLMVPLAVAGAVHGGGLHAPTASWVAFGYLSLFSMFLGFFAWYRGLALGPMTSVSQLQLVQTVFTLAWSALFFGERVSGRVWLAALAVLVCATLASRARIHLSPPS